MSTEEEYIRSSGNVFADLGVADPEGARTRAELTRLIEGILTERRLGEDEAATLLGLDRGELADLIRGRLEGFPLERLVTMLLVLDRDVAILITPRTRSSGRVEVVAAAAASSP